MMKAALMSTSEILSPLATSFHCLVLHHPHTRSFSKIYFIFNWFRIAAKSSFFLQEIGLKAEKAILYDSLMNKSRKISFLALLLYKICQNQLYNYVKNRLNTILNGSNFFGWNVSQEKWRQGIMMLFFLPKPFSCFTWDQTLKFQWNNSRGK